MAARAAAIEWGRVGVRAAWGWVAGKGKNVWQGRLGVQSSALAPAGWQVEA